MDYYKQTQYIAQVDENDNIIGKIEKWEAHKNQILHRAFTVAVFYQGKVILQHRKHVAFDSYFDITASSHQLFEGEQLQDDLTAIYSTLERELNIKKEDLISEPKYVGKSIYKAENPGSDLKEHECNYIYTCEIKELPTPNYDYCYGLILADLKDIKSGKNLASKILAPWVLDAFEKKLL